MPACFVTGTLVDINSSPINAAVVAVRRDDPGNEVPFVDGQALGLKEIKVQTNAQGQFGVSLLQGSRVVIKIDALGLNKQVLVPEAPTATLEELLNADV